MKELFMILALSVFSPPKEVVGFKHVSFSHRPPCPCVLLFNGYVISSCEEADSSGGFVKIKHEGKTVTLYGDVQIIPVKIDLDGNMRLCSPSEIKSLKRKYFLQGF